MRLNESQVEAALESAGLDAPTRVRVLEELKRRASPEGGGFSFATVASYFGALLVLGAMTFFMVLGWETFGGFGIALIASAYIAAFWFAGGHLWREQGQRIPGGLLISIAVSVVPLAVYGIERALNLWPENDPGSYGQFHIWVNGSWLAMEFATLAAGLFAIRRFPFSFITAPMAVALWYLSMDLTPIFFGQNSFSWEERREVSLVCGLIMIAIACIADKRSRVELAFWTHLFGMAAFWGALSWRDSGSELGKFVYSLLNVGFIAFAVFIRRRVYAVFGGVGVFGYLGYLSHQLFKDSLLFPFALTLLGLTVMALAIAAQRKEKELEAWFLELLPKQLHGLRPEERES